MLLMPPTSGLFPDAYCACSQDKWTFVTAMTGKVETVHLDVARVPKGQLEDQQQIDSWTLSPGVCCTARKEKNYSTALGHGKSSDTQGLHR